MKFELFKGILPSTDEIKGLFIPSNSANIGGRNFTKEKYTTIVAPTKAVAEVAGVHGIPDNYSYNELLERTWEEARRRSNPTIPERVVDTAKIATDMAGNIAKNGIVFGAMNKAFSKIPNIPLRLGATASGYIAGAGREAIMNAVTKKADPKETLKSLSQTAGWLFSPYTMMLGNLVYDNAKTSVDLLEGKYGDEAKKNYLQRVLPEEPDASPEDIQAAMAAYGIDPDAEYKGLPDEDMRRFGSTIATAAMFAGMKPISKLVGGVMKNIPIPKRVNGQWQLTNVTRPFFNLVNRLASPISKPGDVFYAPVLKGGKMMTEKIVLPALASEGTKKAATKALIPFDPNVMQAELLKRMPRDFKAWGRLLGKSDGGVGKAVAGAGVAALAGFGAKNKYDEYKEAQKNIGTARYAELLKTILDNGGEELSEEALTNLVKLLHSAAEREDMKELVPEYMSAFGLNNANYYSLSPKKRKEVQDAFLEGVREDYNDRLASGEITPINEKGESAIVQLYNIYAKINEEKEKNRLKQRGMM